MNKQLNCPHCGEATMTAWRRLAFGPIISFQCRACGKKFSLSHRSWLLLLPLFGIVLGMNVIPPMVVVILATFNVVFVCWALLWWVPLVPRGLARPPESAGCDRGSTQPSALSLDAAA